MKNWIQFRIFTQFPMSLKVRLVNLGFQDECCYTLLNFVDRTGVNYLKQITPQKKTPFYPVDFKNFF